MHYQNTLLTSWHDYAFVGPNSSKEPRALHRSRLRSNNVHNISNSLLAFNCSFQSDLFHSYQSSDLCKEGVVLSHPNVVPGPESLAPLSDQDRTRLGRFIVEDFDTESSTNRVSAVACRSTGFLRGHPPGCDGVCCRRRPR